MPTTISLPMFFGLMVVTAPCVLVAVLGVSSLIGRPLAERSISRCVYAANVIGLLSGLMVLGWMLMTGERRVAIELGDWVHIPSYHFSLKFEFDRLSVPFVILTFLLCGTIGAFGSRYLHRERGFNRFFVLYALFVCGMIITSLAGTIETLFAGWEMVGLSSALLVGFFHERPAPVRNGLHVWAVYRIADAALLGAVALHHLHGHGDFDLLTAKGSWLSGHGNFDLLMAKDSWLREQGNFDLLMAKGSWPFGEANLPEHQALIIGLLFLVAAAGKSALVPFSGWLPRAMEGPTPSSAVFYGALSGTSRSFFIAANQPGLGIESLVASRGRSHQ